MIKVGDTIPAVTLTEFVEVEGNGCSIGPNPVDVAKASAGKTIALFALPGAFTPTCSAKHVPGYVEKFDQLKGRFEKLDAELALSRTEEGRLKKENSELNQELSLLVKERDQARQDAIQLKRASHARVSVKGNALKSRLFIYSHHREPHDEPT